METRQRTARPGDVCVLLEPGEKEVPKIREIQTSLQALLDGYPHERVHLTCQRFSLEEGALLAAAIDQIGVRVASLSPVSVTADGFVIVESPFWQSRLLRWRIQVTEDLRRLVTAVEGGLAAAGVRPHFPSAVGWMPTLVTALEGFPMREDTDDRLRAQAFPEYLFTGRQVVLSRIVGQRRFDILRTIQLAE